MPLEFHHGDCDGGDEDAHNIVREELGNSCRIIIHPPVDNQHRACCGDAFKILEPKTHLARNRDIVRAVGSLVGIPRLMQPEIRGGTWYTIDFATEKEPRPVTVIWPDGTEQKWQRR